MLTLPSAEPAFPPVPATPVSTGTISAPDIVSNQALPEIPSAAAVADKPAISAPNVTNEPAIEEVPLPTLDEMEDELNKSGLLLPDLKVTGTVVISEQQTDGSPLASLQPGFKAPAQEFFTAPTPSPPAHANIATSIGQNSVVYNNPALMYANNEIQVGESWRFPLESAIAAVLGVQTVIGLSQALFFGRYQYQPLAQQMINGQAFASDLQNASLKAFALVGLGAMSILFSALVFIYRHDKRILTILAGCVVLIGANVMMQNFVAPPELLSGNPKEIFQAWMNPYSAL